MVLPNFLIIGTPKAETTAVYKYLDQHQKFIFLLKKNHIFFSFLGEQKPHWGVKILAEYERLFAEVKDAISSYLELVIQPKIKRWSKQKLLLKTA